MSIRMTFSTLAVLLPLAVAGVAAAGQAPAPDTSKAGTPPVEDRATYDGTGRRDPFLSLTARGEAIEPRNGTNGVQGLLIGEVSLRGMLRSKGQFTAIVQSPDQKTFTLHAGDTLHDGVVKAITADAVIFLQRVDDPLSPVKQREVRKALRTPEENR